MQKKFKKRIRLIIFLVVVGCLVWFLVLSPRITFHNNEQKLEQAGIRYFELNPNDLPTGERVKTVTLNTLYHKSFLSGDLYIPYTHKTCSIENSWVKVKKENNEYKYYTYLECGILKSNIDHTGPEITLNGKQEVTIGRGEEFSDPGVKSVVDAEDGTLKVDEVTIKNEVDSSTVGTYKVTYTAYDGLSNKTMATRTVHVVQKIAGTTKSLLGEATNFKGNPDNNYLRLSNMLFRIYGVDSNDNVIIVSNEDIANVNYTKIDDWLTYYYDHLNDATKKMIVETKYCNMELSEDATKTMDCSNTTGKKKVYIPSSVEVMRAMDGNLDFMKPYTISWVATSKSGEEAYVTRNIFFDTDEGKDFVPYPVTDNYGVRPMMTIKGDSLILAGKGTEDDPYTFGDTKKAKGGTAVHERYTGEYISIDGMIYRIVETEDDGTTRVISEGTVGSLQDDIVCKANVDDEKITYNPKDKDSVAYYINNKLNEFVDTSHFVNHEIKVPIYDDKIIYGEESSTKKYKVVLSAPDMYEMFAAQPQHGETLSYWLVNTSKTNRITGAIYDIGVPLNMEIPGYATLHVRVVGYLTKDAAISSGSGTYESPYIIK